MGKNSVYAGSASSRMLRYNRVNNIFPGNSVGNVVNQVVKNVVARITNRILFAIDEIFEPRVSTMIKYLIDIGYVLDTIDFVVVKTTDDITNLFTNYYNKGYRLFFSPEKSSVFISLIPFFTKYTDAVYFNSGSTIYLENNEGVPSNMIRTSANVLDNVNFIMKHIVFNFKSKIDLLDDTAFNNLLEHVDDATSATATATSDTYAAASITGSGDVQVFNQVVYICDSTNFTGQQYIDIFNSVIASYCPGKVSLKFFILDIANDKYMFNSELDGLLTENPIDDSQFSASLTKSIFVIKCTNDSNFQDFLNYFKKPEYYKNVIVFNEKFINSPGGVSYYSKYNFTYGFILSGGFSELGYKLCNNIFGDHDIGGEVLAFVDIFTFLPNIYNKVVASGNLTPGPRMLEYLNNLGSINNKQWHVKSSFLYKLDNIYNETTGMCDFNSDVMMFTKKFNSTSDGVASEGNWIDTLIASYPTATGAVSYVTNSNKYPLTSAQTAVTSAQTAVATYDNAVAAVKTAQTAVTSAQTAVTSAQTAVTSAQTAVTSAQTAVTSAQNAVTSAQTAYNNATSANDTLTKYGILQARKAELVTANSALVTANSALKTANSALVTATAALKTANSALVTANSALNTAQATIDADRKRLVTAQAALVTATATTATFLNSLNGESMFFSTLQEITDYTTKLQTFFSAVPSPKSRPSVFGIWKMLSNSVGWPAIDPFSKTVNGIIVSSITINVVVPVNVLINGSVANNNYWLNINSGPHSYVYRDVVAGIDLTDTITIDQVMTFSIDNYLLVFNKGNLYARGIRGPLIVYFQLVPQKISVDYQIGDVLYIEKCDIGEKINVVVDAIAKNDYSYILSVSKFEKENSTDILSTDRSKGVLLKFTPATDVSTSAYVSVTNRLFVNPDITNILNKSLNCWSPGGCYYLALLPSGNLVANDYRSGATFWSSNSTNSSPDYLEFFVDGNNHLIVQLVNLQDDNAPVIYATIYDSVVTNLALLVYPLQLTITDDRQIVIVNKDGALLYSLNNSKKIRTSLSSGDTINVVLSESNKLYSANGWHSLTLSDAGILSFNDESLRFDSGLVTQLYSGYLNNVFDNLSNGVLTLNSTGSCTSLDSFASMASVPPASSFPLSIYTFVLSGFFLAPSSGTYTFSLTSVGTNYLWVGNNALPQNRTFDNANGFGSQKHIVAKTYYPFCIIFTKNGSGNDTFSFNITLPNGNTSNGLGYFFIPHGLAVTTPYFWPSIRPIYSFNSASASASASGSKATYLKFSVDTSNVHLNFVHLNLYNASNNVVYYILDNVGTSYRSNGTFVAPFSFKLTNNRDLQILDSNGKKYWSLDYALQTTINGASSNVVLNYPFPRIGDIVNVGNCLDDRYDGTDARVTNVSYNDRSITVSFFGDDTTRSNGFFSKPEVRDRLITDHDITYSQDDIFASDLELAQLHSPNGWFSTTLDTNGIFRVVDNRNGRKTIWASDPLYYEDYTGTIVNKTFTYRINKLNLDITGVVFINADVTINTTKVTTTTTAIVPNHLFPITDTNSVDASLLVSPYSLILQNNGNMVVINVNGVTIWQTNTSVINVWNSGSVSNPIFQVHDMSYLIYPNFVSQNGQYSLSLKNNVLGIYNKLDELVSGSGKNISKPLFYSGSIVNGGIATTYLSLCPVYSGSGSTKKLTGYTPCNINAVDNGTLAVNNFEYWAKAYNWVNTNMTDTSFVNKIGWIWLYGGATTNGAAGMSDPTFTTIYNNPSTTSISAILYVSTIEQSKVSCNGVELTSIPNSSNSGTWGQVYSASVLLNPGSNTFIFKSYNSYGRCGLTFWCFPTTITSCDLEFNNSGELMIKNINVKGVDSNDIITSVSGLITDYAFSSSTSVAGPYTMTLNDNGSLTIVNGQGTTYFKTPAAITTPLLLKNVLYIYPSSLGKLLSGQNLLPPGAYDDFSQYLWSPDGNFFFGIVSDFFTFDDDITDESGNVTDVLGNDAYYVGAIFDVRFNKPVYRFPNVYIKASAMARPYITLSSNGVLKGYNNGALLWTVGTASTSTGCYLLLDDSGTLSICNELGTVLSSYNDTKNYDNFILSNSISNSKTIFSKPASGVLRLLTSSNGNYTLTFNSNGTLTINYVNIAINNVEFASDDVQDINVFTLYKTIVNSTVGAQKIVFDSDGFLKVYNSSNLETSPSPVLTFGPNSSYVPVPGYYKLVLENSGNLAIYDSQIFATVSDLGNITFNSNSTTTYDWEKTSLLNGYTNAATPYAFQNYRWIWDSDDSSDTVNFYKRYKNTKPSSISAKLFVYCFDGVDIYMNGVKLNSALLESTLSSTDTESNSGLNGLAFTIPANSVSVFKFAAINNYNGPTGLIFWCVDVTGLATTVTNYAMTNKTLFYSNPDTVYCSDIVVMGIADFGVQTWSSGTAYSENVAYGDYDVDNTTIDKRSLRSDEHTFLIPGQKMFCPNGLYYLLFETNGSLSVYLSSSDPVKKLWSNKNPYIGVYNAARLQYVYNADGSGTFGLYDSKGIAYNSTLELTNTISYVFTLDNDWSLRLRGSDGSNREFNTY